MTYFCEHHKHGCTTCAYCTREGHERMNEFRIRQAKRIEDGGFTGTLLEIANSEHFQFSYNSRNNLESMCAIDGELYIVKYDPAYPESQHDFSVSNYIVVEESP